MTLPWQSCGRIWKIQHNTIQNRFSATRSSYRPILLPPRPSSVTSVATETGRYLSLFRRCTKGCTVWRVAHGVELEQVVIWPAVAQTLFSLCWESVWPAGSLLFCKIDSSFCFLFSFFFFFFFYLKNHLPRQAWVCCCCCCSKFRGNVILNRPAQCILNLEGYKSS